MPKIEHFTSGTDDFDAHMSGIKIKGYENPSPFYLKKIFWNIVCILYFLVPKKYTLTLLWDESFLSLNRSNGVSKYPSFHTDVKNVQMTLVKRAPKKVWSLGPDPVDLDLSTPVW